MGAALTIVLGLGNPVRGDDAAGLHVAAGVAALLEDHPISGVRVATSTRAGFELIDLLTGADRAIIVDCLEVPDAAPGRVRRLSLGDVAGSARLVGAHDIGVATAWELARSVGAPMPAEVEILGIEAADTTTITESLSPAIAQAVPEVARRIYAWLSGPPGAAL